MSVYKYTVKGDSAQAKSTSMDGSSLLHQRKHRRALREAEALLENSTPSVARLEEELNCGKLAKLFKYLRQGYIGVIILTFYSEAFCR